MRRREHIEAFVAEIWAWYARHKRNLPWRDLQISNQTSRAYRIFVSEVMLQQTQVPRVEVTYKRFLELFPTLQDLATASNRDVLIAWRGMGYNSRALRLRDAAKTIVVDFKGIFPKTMEELQSIKGVGHYTAAAIRNFAFGLPTPCLDTNIRRVLHRTFIGFENSDGTWKKDDRHLLKLAEDTLEVALKVSGSANWHAALMDFGALVQTKRNPKWDICPLTKNGLMKARPRHFLREHFSPKRAEPGRFVGTVYIPNRIFRGKIVEELRDTKRGLPLHELGKRICLDWKSSEHQAWLRKILRKLEEEQMIEEKGVRYVLKT